jgi:hypothetical protein
VVLVAIGAVEDHAPDPLAPQEFLKDLDVHQVLAKGFLLVVAYGFLGLKTFVLLHRTIVVADPGLRPI